MPPVTRYTGTKSFEGQIFGKRYNSEENFDFTIFMDIDMMSSFIHYEFFTLFITV